MVENLQREDLNAIDKASAFSEYLSRYGGTQEELAGRLGVDRSTVSNLIRLLDLPADSPGRRPHGMRSPRATPGHSWASRTPRASPLPADRIIDEHLSVRQTEALVTTGVPTPSRPRVRKDPAHEHRWPRLPIFSISNNASIRCLGTPVLIRARNPDRGQIIIDYQTREELDRLASLLRASGRLVRICLRPCPTPPRSLKSRALAPADRRRRVSSRREYRHPLRSDEGSFPFPGTERRGSRIWVPLSNQVVEID